ILGIGGLEPCGDFRLPSADELGNLRLWFYIDPHYRLRSLMEQDLAWHVAARDHRFAYVVVIAADEPEGMPVPHVHLDKRPLSTLAQRLDAVDSELDEFHWQRVALTRWNELLSRTIALADDRAARQFAAQQAWDDPSVFAVQGWAPTEASDEIRSFAQNHALGLTMEPPSSSDQPPTLLDNRGVTAGGQDAVTFYTTPAYRAWDPSLVVFLSFSVFFAMIMADAGYALLLAGMLLFLWRRLGRSNGTLRLRKLLLAIVIASITYGVAVGSYFGRSPASGSIWQKLHVIDAANTTLMMKISIAIGVAHLALANLALAWNRRWSPMMLSSFGWISILLGGLALGFGKTGMQPKVELTQYGGWALAAGTFGVLLFSSERPLLSLKWRDHGMRVVDGLKSLTGITRAFGDVLSYLRLFALGLASAQLAATFNDLTYQASCCVGIGTLLAGLVVVFGHGLNFALAIMSGVVHGLRLNCIEFFGWSLPDEGYPFEPFCRKAM
ncbi:MAG: ATPase V, partial [Planctomycetales bacterium]|nr:ATPase V [Planctomycetales bacterium]